MVDIFHSLLANVWPAFLVVLFFGGSIFVHELGHFLAARRRGVHVERFSIGFGPAIWSHRGRDGVEYGHVFTGFWPSTCQNPLLEPPKEATGRRAMVALLKIIEDVDAPPLVPGSSRSISIICRA